MTDLQIMRNKQEYLELLASVKRQGIYELCQWLEQSDFFTAPASTKFHLCCRGGLCKHSLDVYHQLSALVEIEDLSDKISQDSIVLAALLHDLCKVNFYKIEMRNVKVNNQWIQQPVYVIDDQMPLGHGEKSVILALQYIMLTSNETLAIRWHMSGYDRAVKGGEFAIGEAANKCKLVTLLQCADMLATYVTEVDNA